MSVDAQREALPLIMLSNSQERLVPDSRTHDSSTPWIAILLSKCTSRWPVRKKTRFFKYLTMALTFITYMTYHMTRKVISVVTPVLKNGSSSEQGWDPFDDEKSQDLLIGLGLDSGFLFAYALGMFVAGHVAERVDLRYFLTCGMTLSAIFTALFGLGYFLEIHNFLFFLMSQILNGLAQSTGWPAVVPLMGNWFGYGKRGLILGVWNCHTSVGNILGNLLAGAFVDTDWGLSFIVPAGVMMGVAILVFLCLVPYPEMVFCSNPNHQNGTEDQYLIDEGVVDSQAVLSSDEDYHSIGDSNDHIRPMPPEKNHEQTTEGYEERTESQKDKPAIGIKKALMVPGVIEYAMCLFFNKLVNYSFLYWLPSYIQDNQNVSSQAAANIAIAFDMGGIVGGIMMGVISDALQERSLITAISIILALPFMLLYNEFGSDNAVGIPLLILTGMMVNGPYALITTAISADLGTHEVLRKDSRALATVTAIIDGTGSLGSAIGVIICFELHTDDVFYFLVASNFVALLFLTRLLIKSVDHYRQKWRSRNLNRNNSYSEHNEHVY